MQAARLLTTLQIDHSNPLGFLVKDNGGLTVNKNATLELLLETNFLGGLLARIEDLYSLAGMNRSLSRPGKAAPGWGYVSLPVGNDG
ncbi:hypothetical protein J6590_069854 [Homalodisca vitripennis]|nr:hypothetical protein J6590_069854 [Homalodisca vitripennis]